jgi:hypothetical protein
MDMLLWFPQKVCRTWKGNGFFRKLFVGSLICPRLAKSGELVE